LLVESPIIHWSHQKNWRAVGMRRLWNYTLYIYYRSWNNGIMLKSFWNTRAS
jgi:hypothetical protein